MPIRFRVIALLSLLCCQVQAQYEYAWPIKAQLPLTGNYGEIRPNHFHMGIDISTQNKENYQVQAIADGWVSRIRISSSGYGKSIYITHADGHLSLYAHLNKFEEPIADFVKKLMYEQKLNEFDINLNEGQLQIKKGQVIALSGNTGGSSGPHLHFEIRDTKTEIPLNPLLFYKPSDKIKPTVTALVFYNLRDSLAPKVILNKVLKVQKLINDTVVMPPVELPQSQLGLGFDGYDLLESKGNKNQIAKAELKLDSNLIYSHYFSQLQFDDARYVNEFSDKKAGLKLQKCFLPEQFPTGMHDTTVNRGRIILRDTLWHRYTLTLSDESGNKVIAIGEIKCSKINEYAETVCSSSLLAAGQEKLIATDKFSIYFPKKTLYTSLCLQSFSEGRSLTIAPADINLHSAIKIGIQDSTALNAKWVLVNGTTVVAGKVSKDSVFFDCKSLGTWQLQRDTLPPTVQPLFPKGKQAKNAKRLKFLISDRKSGIASYELYINGNWHPAYLDAKSSQLILELDTDVPKGMLKIKVIVKDKCGNTSEVKTQFNYQ